MSATDCGAGKGLGRPFHGQAQRGRVPATLVAHCGERPVQLLRHKLPAHRALVARLEALASLTCAAATAVAAAVTAMSNASGDAQVSARLIMSGDAPHVPQAVGLAPRA